MAEDFTPLVPSRPPNRSMQNVIPAYLYRTYANDPDLVALIKAFNELAQGYLDWFNQTLLADYTTPSVSGDLLDWVAEGLYGMRRPLLPETSSQTLGPMGTFAFNTLTPNELLILDPSSFFATSDDLFRRIITWNYYQGDGRVFTIRWLKRRVQRFLTGQDGGPGQTDQTYQVSVTISDAHEVTIRILNGIRTVTGGAIFNDFKFNTTRPNELLTDFTPLPAQPEAALFKAAVASGALQLPFQYTYTVLIG